MEIELMFNKKILAVSMAVAMTGGLTAGAQANVKVTNNDIGQVLLGPVFYVENGFTTDITITNTRTDAAVKAKVVFRSHEKSREILDFVIYLTPGDVWRGQVIQNSGDNLGHIISSDDSIRASGEWGNVVTNDIPFFTHALSSADSTTFGHFEVIAAYAAAGTYSAAATGITGGVTIVQKMAKDSLKAVFDAVTATTISHNTDFADCTPLTINDTAQDPDGTVSSIAPCSTQLLGEVRIGSTGQPNRASMRTTALGLGNATAGVADEAAAFAAGYVIHNRGFDVDTGTESLLGVDFGRTLPLVGAGLLGTTVVGDNIRQIETGLNAKATSYEYENTSTEATHTSDSFVSKYRHEDDTAGICGGGAATASNTGGKYYSAPFQNTYVGEVNYSYTSFNNSEESKTSTSSEVSGGPTASIDNFPNEVNYYFTMDNFSTSGWAYYNWLPRAGCAYNGVPVITYSYKFRPGTTSTEAMLQRAANKD
jgi:hypothetical protein